MKRIVALLAIILLASCSAFDQSIKVSCNAPEGIPRSNLLLFGEMHGSVESPEVIGRIACARALEGPTVVGLELPTKEQTAIESYLASDGSKASRARLLSGPFWQQSKDGRSSMAMIDLIEYVRKLKQQDIPLTVFAFDAQTNIDTSRDSAIAQSVRNFRAANPSLPIVALMGRVHASQAPIHRGDQLIITSGSLLQDLNPTSVLLGHPSGTIWACMPDCDIHQVDSSWGTAKQSGFTNESPMLGYSTTYVLPSITASPPAIDVPR